MALMLLYETYILLHYYLFPLKSDLVIEAFSVYEVAQESFEIAIVRQLFVIKASTIVIEQSKFNYT